MSNTKKVTTYVFLQEAMSVFVCAVARVAGWFGLRVREHKVVR